MNDARSLSKLMLAAGLSVPAGTADIPVKNLRLDSRQIEPGDCFLALRGNSLDGMSFAGEAARRGAAAILAEGFEPGALHGESGIPILVQPELRKHVGSLFDAWHGFPSRHLEACGVTGTNGKSTTTFLISGILRAAGRKVISLGTIRYEIGDEVLDSQLTTPATDALFDLLARGVRKGCDALVMEVSSHSLSQDRIGGLRFKRAVFTNLTQDHFDFHSGFEEYFAAKKKLFTEYLAPDGMGVINLDSPFGSRLAAEWKGSRMTFSRGETHEGRDADVVLRHAELSLSGTRLTIAARPLSPSGGSGEGLEFEIRSLLVGALNVENLLAAVTFGLSLNLPHETIAAGIAEVTVPGRNERIPLTSGGIALVDYAHTPDALDRALGSLRPLVPGKLVCLFGCGGDRDRSKRPLMGAIAERLSDHVVLSNDNPRSENPSEILAEILGGMKNPEAVEIIEDRATALRQTLAALGKGDCLLVAGKGHEAYQIVGGARRHFSDQEEIREWNRKREAGSWS